MFAKEKKSFNSAKVLSKVLRNRRNININIITFIVRVSWVDVVRHVYHLKSSDLQQYKLNFRLNQT